MRKFLNKNLAWKTSWRYQNKYSLSDFCKEMKNNLDKLAKLTNKSKKHIEEWVEKLLKTAEVEQE